MMANANPIITLKRWSHRSARLGLAPTHSPKGEPRLGPILPLRTKSPMAWPALSASPNKSATVPATFVRAVDRAMPDRNINIMSIGRLDAYAVPYYSQRKQAPDYL